MACPILCNFASETKGNGFPEIKKKQAWKYLKQSPGGST
jgi:hypothetical protein